MGRSRRRTGRRPHAVRTGIAAQLADRVACRATVGNLRRDARIQQRLHRSDFALVLLFESFVWSTAHSWLLTTARETECRPGFRFFLNRLYGVPRIACYSQPHGLDRKSTRLNSSHVASSYAVFCLK